MINDSDEENEFGDRESGQFRKNLFPILEQLAVASQKTVLPKKTWGPVVPAPRMATSNHGNKNIIDKAKEYQKRKKNLEIPPCFRGQKLASVKGVLGKMVR